MKKCQKAFIGVTALAACAFSLAGCRQLRPPRSQAMTQARTSPVQRGTLVMAVDATGNITAHQKSDLSFGVAGRARAVHA